MTNEPDETNLGPEAAMNRALVAEREAAEAIRRCEEEAEQRLDRARNRARRIAERTDVRISRLRDHFAVASKTRDRERIAEADQINGSLSLRGREAELLKEAVRRLAEKLTTTERREPE